MIIVWGIAILALALFLISSIMKGQNVLKTSFGKNDPNGFYQATLFLTESDI